MPAVPQPYVPGRRTVDRLLVLLVLAGVIVRSNATWEATGSAWRVAAVAAAGVAVLLAGRNRRDNPLPLAVVLLGASLVGTLVTGSDIWTEPALAAIYFVQAYEPRPRLRLALVGGIIALLVGLSLLADSIPFQIETAFLVLAVLGWGQGTRSAALYRASLVQRAEDAERERDLRAAQAVIQERTRIARDIHDIVSHSLAVVVVQASGAERIAEKQPAMARDALGVIARTAREALTEMRALLQVLRGAEGTSQDKAPTKGLGHFEQLAQEMTDRGFPVRYRSTGEADTLGAGAELALYRVTQEALTNALKHGDRSTPARLTIEHGPAGAVVEIVNAARMPTEPVTESDQVPGSGSGLAGMHERLAAYGGSMEAGPVGHTYRVRATIPRPSDTLGTQDRSDGGQVEEAPS